MDERTPESEAALVKISRKLLELREKRGLSRRALAEKAGIHEDALQKIELMQRMPNVDTLVRLATALDYPVTKFL